MEKIKVCCSLLDGSSNFTVLEFSLDDTIEEVIKQNCNKYGLDPKKYSIYFFGNMLKNHLTLRQVNYFPDAVLFLETKATGNSIMPQSSDQQQFDERIVHFESLPDDVLEHLRASIQNLYEDPTHTEIPIIEEILQHNTNNAYNYEPAMRHEEWTPAPEFSHNSAVNEYMRNNNNKQHYPLNIRLSNQQKEQRNQSITDSVIVEASLFAYKDLVTAILESYISSDQTNEKLSYANEKGFFGIQNRKLKHFEMDQSFLNRITSEYRITQQKLQTIFNLARGDCILTENLVKQMNRP